MADQLSPEMHAFLADMRSMRSVDADEQVIAARFEKYLDQHIQSFLDQIKARGWALEDYGA